jgi:hypothetical protein
MEYLGVIFDGKAAWRIHIWTMAPKELSNIY